MATDAERSTRFDIAPKWLIPVGIITLLWVLHHLSLDGMQPDTEDKGKLCLKIAGHVWLRPFIWYFTIGIFAVHSAALMALFATKPRYWILSIPIPVASLYVPGLFIVQCGRIIP